MAILLDSYSESNKDASFASYEGSVEQWCYQTFSNDSNVVLDSCKFYLSKTGSPTGNIYAYLYSHQGTYGETGGLDGDALAVSDAINVTTLSSSFSLQTFTFSGANRVGLTPGAKYCIFVTVSGGSTGVNDRMNVGLDSSSPTHGGNAGKSPNGAVYTPTSEFDLTFYVYGEPAGVSPSASRSPSASSSASWSPSASLSPSASASLSSSASLSPSASRSPSSSSSSSSSASLSPSASLSSSSSSSASLSPSASRSPSASASSSASASPSAPTWVKQTRNSATWTNQTSSES